MKSILAKTDDGTITLSITIPWAEIQKNSKKVVDEAVKEVEVKGFRKGKAPRDVAEKQLDKNKIYEEVIRRLIPQVYTDAVKEHKLRPVIQPEIKLVKAKKNEDWQVQAKTCEKPEVDLKNYKEIVKSAKAESKKDDIWVPGKDAKKEDQQDPAKKKQQLLEKILSAFVEKIKVKVPSIITETEIAQRMSRLVDELEKLGLTVERYLQTKGKTPEQFQKETRDEIVKKYSLEFILEEIADQEKIVVDNKEIEKVITQAKNEAEKKALESQKYYLASVLRRQKTLDRIANL